MSESARLVTAAEIARLAEVKPAAVSNWKRRHPDFPQAMRRAGSEVYSVSQITAWLDQRTVAEKDRQPGEYAEITYGIRFRRNLGSPSRAAGPPTNTGDQLWRALVNYGTHRGIDRVSLLRLALGLLYLRFYDTPLWSELAKNTDPLRRVEELANAALSAGDNQLWPSRRVRVSVESPSDLGYLATAIRVLDRQDDWSGSDDARAVPVAGQIAEDLLSRFAAADGPRGEHLTPPSVVQLAVRLTNPTGHARIYDPFCRAGELLVGAANHVRSHGGQPADLEISGRATDPLRWLAGMNLALHGIGAHEIAAGQLLHDLGAPRRFDLVLTNPPFNLSHWADESFTQQLTWRYGSPPQHNSNFAWLQHAVASLVEGGRAAVLMPHGAGSSENSRERTIRAAMVEDGIVDAIIALPPQLFHSTAIPVTLWLLRGRSPGELVSAGEDEILFIDAHTAGAMDGRNHRILREEDLDRIVGAYRSRSTILAGDVLSRVVARGRLRDDRYMLNPGRYLIATAAPVYADRNRSDADDLRDQLRWLLRGSIESHDRAERQMDASADLFDANSTDGSRVRLGDVCDVLAGPSGAVISGGGTLSGVPVVKPRNISENRIVRDGLDFVEPTAAGRLDRYRLRPGDVVCTRTGEIGRSALVTKEQDTWLLGTSCLRLRPRHPLESTYLIFYLGHPRVQLWLAGNAGGSTVRSLTAATVRDLPLILPAGDRQRLIGAAMTALDEQVAIHDQIRRTTSALRETLAPLYLRDSLLDEDPEET